MKKSPNMIGYFSKFLQDKQMYSSHLSLYVALFELWERNKFRSPFSICRKEVMKLSKIKSYATYHKCIKEVQKAGFVVYLPNYNSYEGSLIEIIDYRTFGEDDVVEVQGSEYSNNETVVFSIPKFCEVELYFSERDLLSDEAEFFYSTYQTKYWKLSNNTDMKCWKSAARNWISKLKNANQTSMYEGNRS